MVLLSARYTESSGNAPRRLLHRDDRSQDLRRFARFPDTVFNPGANLAETFAAEQRAQVIFPDEVRASFVLFNGQARSVWLRSEVGVDDVDSSRPRPPSPPWFFSPPKIR